jgi:hypothetical protein
MKILMMLLLFSITLSFADDDEPQVGDEVAISVQNQSIYPMPAFYASPVQPVSYGTIAQINEINGEWYRITTSLNQTGWIHSTSVTGAIQASSGDVSASGSVTSDEIMLAGRGFSEAVEESYAGEHPELNFLLVDNMEATWNVSPEELYDFLVAGNLIDATTSTTQPETAQPETPQTSGGTRP